MTTVGSLCSGYGGLDLGLELGLGQAVRHAWHVEYDAAPASILRHRYPEVPNYGDLTTLDHAALEPVDWLTAGYPCQPFSQAGLRKGADDERHLWPYVAATIGALRPRHVLLENVRGHLRLGFDAVLGDLAALGYDARWGVVRASDAGAPHRRERVFVIAEDADRAARGERRLAAPGQAQSGWARPDAGGRGGAPASSDPDSAGLEGLGELHAAPGEGQAAAHDRVAWGPFGARIARWECVTGRAAPRPTQPARRGERLSPRFVEWLMGLPAGWVTEVPGLAHNAQLKALGNGVVPQQAALAVRLLTATSVEAAA